MKKHLFLTSLVALIATASTANATYTGYTGAIDGDSVNFNGKVVHTYTDSDGKTHTELVDADKEEPTLADYTWNNAGATTALTEKAMKYTTADFKDTASFDEGTAKSLQAGQTLDMNNYTYEYDDNEFVLSVDKDGNFVASGVYTELVDVAEVLEDASIELANDVHVSSANINVTNGTAAEYGVTVGQYNLVKDGSTFKLEDPSRPGETIAIESGSDLETSFNNAQAAYNAIKAVVDTKVTSTQADVDAEETAAATVMADYVADAGKLDVLNASYESLQEAKANFNHDSVNYAEVQTAQAIMAKSIKATISDANEEVHGKIHGLITEENGAKKFNGTGKVASTRLDEDGNYVGDLAVGTTTEEHLVSLDNAIGAEVDRAKAAESALRSDLATTDAKVNSLEKNVSGGVAAATALSAVEVSNVKKGEMSVGGGYGYYNSQSAMALGAALGLSDNWSVNAGAGIASGDKTQVSFRAGTNYKFKLF